MDKVQRKPRTLYARCASALQLCEGLRHDALADAGRRLDVSAPWSPADGIDVHKIASAAAPCEPPARQKTHNTPI